MKKIGIAALAIIVLLSGMVTADNPISATRETQGITTETHVVVYGTFTDSASCVMTTSNQDLRNNPPLNQYSDDIDDTGALDPASQVWTPEGQYTVSYSETTLADNGYIEWDKVVNLDTGNKVANQNNFQATTQFDFVSADDAFGRATFYESLMLDGASQGSSAGSSMLCPFATGDNGFIPAYCNVVEMGSSFTGSRLSMVTTARERHVAASADVPAGMDYSVGLSGVGTASAWINAHIMEGRTGYVFDTFTDEDGVEYSPAFYNPDMDSDGFMQGVDMTYKEMTTASGTIESFSKSMSFQSGMRRI